MDESMGERAYFQKSYLLRYLTMLGVFLPFSIWFFYDGLIGYPKKLEYAKAYDPLRELDAEERNERWQAITKEKGWPNNIPEKTAAEVADSITGQYVWGTLAFIVAMVALIYYLGARGSWVERTETGITTSWGQTMNFSDVITLNKKQWENKGKAKVTYRDNTLTRVFLFDDFKFDRPPIGRMLRSLEQTLEPGQIVGGPPEPPEEEEPST
jgi:hypothetical protein